MHPHNRRTLVVIVLLVAALVTLAYFVGSTDPEQADASSVVPLPAGWTEANDCKYWHWGVADPRTKTIHYCPQKIKNRAAIDTYTRAHERCHALAFEHIEPWNPYDEREADACAARHGVSISPSPYS